MKRILQNPTFQFIAILAIIAAGIAYTWYMYSTGQFGQYNG